MNTGKIMGGLLLLIFFVYYCILLYGGTVVVQLSLVEICYDQKRIFGVSKEQPCGWRLGYYQDQGRGCGPPLVLPTLAFSGYRN